MKKRYIREFMPYVTAGLVLTASVIVSKNSPFNGNIKLENTNDCVFPIYNEEKSEIEMKSIKDMEMLIVELEERPVLEFNQGNPVTFPVTEYVILKPDEISDIVYSSDNQSLTITLKDSDVYYLGTYNDIENKYFYTQYGKENMIEINKDNQLTKKF